MFGSEEKNVHGKTISQCNNPLRVKAQGEKGRPDDYASKSEYCTSVLLLELNAMAEY